MENNKEYYTPEIDELFVGYEYEVIMEGNPKTWVKMIVNSPRLDYLLNVKNFANGSVEYSIPECIRTKYLDKQDIEQQGWEFNLLGKDDWFKGQIHKDTPYEELHYPFELWFRLDKYWLGFYKAIHKIVILEKGDFPNGQTIRFNGLCKSKNELSKLMKDYLNIKTK